MKHNIEFKNFDPDKTLETKDGIRKLIETCLARLEKSAKALPPDAVSARVMIEQNLAHKLYHVTVTLEVPEKTLAAKKETHNLAAGIRQAFAEIHRQLDHHKATLRGERQWKQIERRDQVRHNRSKIPASELSEVFFEVVKPHLNRLKEFATHVVGLAEDRGDLVPGQLTPDDLVDATLVEAYTEFLMNPTPGNLQTWLIRLATKQLAAEVERTRLDSQRAVHIETDIPETPPREEVTTLGDEILDFYQPDEDLKMEDILPEIEISTPELEAEKKELRECVRTAFDSMPMDSRRALLLRYIQGMDEAQLAKVLQRPMPEIRRLVEDGRAYLREKLIESGCTFSAVESEESLRTTVAATEKKLVE